MYCGFDVLTHAIFFIMAVAELSNARKKRPRSSMDIPGPQPLIPASALEMLSDEEDEEDDRDDSDHDEVDEFPEIDPESDSDPDSSVEDAGSQEDEESDSVSEDLDIFPRAKDIISDITGQPRRVYPEIEPDYDSDSSTEEVRRILWQ